MKKLLLYCCILLLADFHLEGTICFLAKENKQIIVQEGNCELRHSPCSTFKIALSLMAYNEGIIQDQFSPQLPFIEGSGVLIDTWKQPQNPTTWIKNSCVWFSQVITQQLGMQKFKEYVTKFNYGNHDVTGDKDKDDGLMNSWRSSSLQISTEEQTIFLEKLLADQLPVSKNSHEMTKNILFTEDLIGNWKLYGKTGSDCLSSKDDSTHTILQIGWFVGWITNGFRTIIFACYLEDVEKTDFFASRRAKEVAKKKLINLLDIL